VGPLYQVRLDLHIRYVAPDSNEGMETQVFVDGEIVTHIADRKRKCEFRDHGVVDSTVPVDKSYDGKDHPGWIGVTWTRAQWRHPKENLFPCECPA
jgi:hypothetical protein